MHEFKVWAPEARTVKLQIEEALYPLMPGDHGWWSAQVEGATAGADYTYLIDGNGPFPDPRTLWQPHGVHGASRLLDHQAFPWTDKNWQPIPFSQAVVYELHIGTFTPGGTFESAIERLDYLKDLGITHVELMPVSAFPGKHGWGYDGVHLFAPHAAYGGPEGLKRLVDACHARDLAVLLDVVYNHLGPVGNYLARFGPYFTQSYSTPWGPAMNLDDRGSDEVRRFLCDNALMWLRDYHFDGLRLDAVHAYFDRSAVHFLEQLTTEVEALEDELGRALVLIAESDLNNPRVVDLRGSGGMGCHAQWSDDFHHALHAILTGERGGYYADFGAVADLAKAYRDVFVYDGGYSEFRGRSHGRPAGKLSGHAFLGYLQNHDQIGNRAAGERSGHLLSTERLKIAAALVLTSPFVPMLFQGEEFAASTPFLYFTDHEDEAFGKAVSAGRRNEFAAFGWNPDEVPDPQHPDTFEQSRLKWDETTWGHHAELLDWHRRLIRFRRANPAWMDGDREQITVRFDEAQKWFVAERRPFVIAFNLGVQSRSVPLPGAGQILLSSSLDAIPSGSAVTLPPDTVAILQMK